MIDRHTRAAVKNNPASSDGVVTCVRNFCKMLLMLMQASSLRFPCLWPAETRWEPKDNPYQVFARKSIESGRGCHL